MGLQIDTPTINRLGDLFPEFAHKMLMVYGHMYQKHGLTMRCTTGLRTMAAQAELYAQGRTKPGKIVTNAKPGDSWHHYGLAADSCFLGNDPYLQSHPKRDLIWKDFGDFCKMEGLEWGGDWNGNGIRDKNDFDLVHVQKSYGLKLSEVKAIHEDGGKDHLWQYLASLMETTCLQS